jgi:hypothetical protein
MSTTAQDYLKTSKKAPKEVTLPSGAVFLVRRPSTFWFAANANVLPQNPPLQDDAAAPARSAEEQALSAQRNRKMICEHVVAPKLSENGEFTPDDLNDEDVLKLIKFLYGLEDENGVSFRSLPAEPVDTRPGVDIEAVGVSA